MNYQGMFLIEIWADNSTCQSMGQATKKIAEAYQFVIEKMQEAGMGSWRDKKWEIRILVDVLF